MALSRGVCTALNILKISSSVSGTINVNGIPDGLIFFVSCARVYPFSFAQRKNALSALTRLLIVEALTGWRSRSVPEASPRTAQECDQLFAAFPYSGECLLAM